MDALRDLLTDSFTRVAELVEDLTDGLTPEIATYRVDPDANTVAWLLWHLTRVQDDHVAGVARSEQVWPSFSARFGLPFGDDSIGYGHSSDDVAAVRPPADLLAEYHAAVHAASLRCVAGVDEAALARVVDASFDPPVTAAVRLVSVLGDCLQHAGQAAFVRGVAERR